MAEYFKRGTKIPLTNGDLLVVKDRLGEGGQGVVYSVTVGVKDYALKWYHKGAIANPKRFYKNVGDNIMKGQPTSAFLWPLFLTEEVDGRFGYVMNLRAKNYKEFGDFLLARARFGSISAALTACINITNGFYELHRNGFSYQDLNDGNFFIDPATGDVMISDNDNVAPYGEALGIAGKARYMAPEVVRNQRKPDIHTDRFSLAVILFRILFLDHPLEGKQVISSPCLTEELELRYFGKNPVFIYDRADSSNAPVRGVHGNVIRFWQLYPKMIRDMFTRAFEKEIMQDAGRQKRPTDREWQIAFTQLRDMLIVCPCGGETFFDPAESSAICIHCQAKIPRPSILSVDKYKVVLFPGQKLYLCHIESADSSDAYKRVCGEVIRNPKNPQIWGLKNLSGKQWIAT
ncbi:MAG: protein kinase, partial [Oscillospiraceae bacterium]|nr:protein kinase [Oscillospiraceae bacterium]